MLKIDTFINIDQTTIGFERNTLFVLYICFNWIFSLLLVSITFQKKYKFWGEITNSVGVSESGPSFRSVAFSVGVLGALITMKNSIH